MGVSAVRWSVREARSRRSWIHFSWDKKPPSGVEEISIPKKYLRGTRSNIKNWSLRWDLTKAMYLRRPMIITSDDHVIYVKEKSPTTRWHVDEESRIMSAGRKNNSCDHRSKALKPNPRSLLKAIKGVTKVTNHTLKNKILR
jgi:hypothetical protein